MRKKGLLKKLRQKHAADRVDYTRFNQVLDKYIPDPPPRKPAAPNKGFMTMYNELK